MSRPAENMETKNSQDDNVKIVEYNGYVFDYKPDVLKPDRDLTDKQLFAYMCSDILEKEGITLTQGRFEKLVDDQIEAQEKGKVPLIKPPMTGDIRERSWYSDEASNKYLGYEISISPALQEEVSNRGIDLRNEQLNSPEMKAYHAETLEARGDAEKLLAKLEKVAEYSRDHDLHGLTQIFDKQMRESGSRATSLKEFLNTQPPPQLSDIQKRVDAGYEFLNIKGARDKDPNQIVAVFEGLDRGFKDAGEKLQTAVSFLPGGGTALAKGIGLGLEVREIWNEVHSGKVTLEQAIEKRLEKQAVDLVTGKLGKAIGGGNVSDNPGVQKMKEFVAGSASDYGKAAVELYKKGAGADEYKTKLADVLVTNFVKTAGGSIKSISGDDEKVKQLMDAAVKYGIEEPVKKALENAKNAEKRDVSSLVPQQTVDGVRDLKLPQVETQDNLYALAGNVQATATRENVSPEKFVATEDKTKVFVVSGDPTQGGSYHRSSPIDVKSSIAQSTDEVVANLNRANQEATQANTPALDKTKAPSVS